VEGHVTPTPERRERRGSMRVRNLLYSLAALAALAISVGAGWKIY
jgi:hypothetical protein